MSDWTHQICDKCWKYRNPERRPVRLREPDAIECCFCGKENRSGIFVRKAPAHPELVCRDSKYHAERA